MIKVNYNYWQHTTSFLREQAIIATHKRTRERLLALYEITQGKSASQVAYEIKRRPNTVLDWVHAYNNKGLEALSYKKTGGRLPLFCLGIRNNLAIALTESLDYAACPPQNREEKPQPRWTIKRFLSFLDEKYDFKCCRETCRKALKHLGFSWKKARKLLNKANKQARIDFVEKLKALLDSATKNEQQIIYIDEAHIHLDTDEGYGWSIKGEPFWVSSSSPGLQKVSFYGAYFYNKGKVGIYPYDKGNGLNTISLLKKIRAMYENQEPITIIWDGASYHRSHIVMDAAKELNITIQRLPAYSPDFMPVEHLWQWLREDVTYHICYDEKSKLITHLNSLSNVLMRNQSK